MTSRFIQKARLSKISAIFLWSVLALWFVNVFGVFTLTMPRIGIDSSWCYALNQAVAQGLIFGKDIVFTFGPYAAVFTRVYHPATIVRTIAGILLLDALYVACFVWLVKDARWRWPSILLAIMTVVVMSKNAVLQDAFFLSESILPSMILFKLWRRYDAKAFSRFSTQLLIVLAFACLGLLPLIKGTLIITTAGNCALAAIFLAFNRRRLLATQCLAAPALTMVAFWCASGQPLLALPNYFSNMKYIVSGYSQAMATNGSPFDLLISLAASTVILSSIVINKVLPKDQKIFLLLTFTGFLFMGFKQGFVRQDYFHIPVCMNCLAIGILFLEMLNDARPAIAHLKWLGFALLAICIFRTWHADFSDAMKAAEPAAERARNLPISGRLNSLRRELGMKKFISIALSTRPFQMQPWNFNMASWPTQFEQAKREINDASGLNFAMPGTVDVYTQDLSSLLAHDYHWNPRPILQSYSAYTPELLRLNEEHLRSERAPDHLVIRLETIDNRLPSLDDGLSWPAMLDNYELSGTAGDWVRLTMKPDASRKAASRYTSVQTTSAKLGEEVKVPVSYGLTFVSMSVSSSVLGKLIGVAYKNPPLTIRLTRRNGEQADFRINANMMMTGFLLSPLVTSTQDFQRLFNPGDSSFEQNRVASFDIVAPGSGRMFWKDAYTITFEQYQQF